MRVSCTVSNDETGEIVSLAREGVETVEDMLQFFHRVMEASGYPYIDGVGAISKKQRFVPKEWWSTI
jgi:hypothetical protein